MWVVVFECHQPTHPLLSLPANKKITHLSRNGSGLLNLNHRDQSRDDQPRRKQNQSENHGHHSHCTLPSASEAGLARVGIARRVPFLAHRAV